MYGLGGNRLCGGDIQAPVGTWTLTLTSVTPASVDAVTGVTYATAHGSLVATLVRGALPDDAGPGRSVRCYAFNKLLVRASRHSPRQERHLGDIQIPLPARVAVVPCDGWPS